MNSYPIVDFSGGERSSEHAVFAANEMELLKNLWCKDGHLRVMEGQSPWNTEVIKADNVIDSLVTTVDRRIESIYEFSTSDYTRLIAKRGQGYFSGQLISLEIESSVTAGTTLTLVSGVSSLMSEGFFIYRGTVYHYTGKNDTNNTLTIGDTTPSGSYPAAITVGSADIGETIKIGVFRPFHAEVLQTSGATYLLNGSSSRPERASFAHASNGLYFCLNDMDSTVTAVDANPAMYRLNRWTVNSYYATGKVSCDGTTTVTAKTGGGAVAQANFVTAGIPSGDGVPLMSIFFYNHTLHKWVLATGASSGRTIATVESATSLTLHYAGPNTSTWSSDGYVDYVIVHTHPAGVPTPSGAPTCTPGDGGTLSGVYKYKFRWKSTTAPDGSEHYTSNFSAVTTTASLAHPNDQVTISFASRPQLDITIVEIYRTEANGSLFYLLDAATVGDAGFSYVDDGTITDVVLVTHTAEDATDAYHNVPPSMGYVRNINSRLHFREAGSRRHWVGCSTYGQYEYCPTTVLQNATGTAGTAADLLGMRFECGAGSGDSITDIIPESGTYSTTGDVGHNLLYLTLHGNHKRLYGLFWSDWVIREAFSDAIICDASAVNYDGQIFAISTRGVITFPSGGNNPELISNKIFPNGLTSYLENERAVDLVQVLPWSTTYWNGYFVMASQTPLSLSGAHDRVWFYHIESGAWTHMDGPFHCVYTGADGTLYGGTNITSGVGSDNVGLICRLGVGCDGFNNDSQIDNGSYTKIVTNLSDDVHLAGYQLADMPIRVTTSPLYLGDIHHEKKALSVTACIRMAVDAQSVTGYLYANGDTSTPVATLASQAVSTDSYGVKRQFLTWTNLGERAVFFQIAILATLTRQISIEWIKVDYETGAEVRKAT